ncbi:MAG: putative inorganic carbon transporter subunit DabA [Verrucomicrobiota bacterium]
MHTMLAYLSLAGPVLLLGCLLLPDSRVRLLKAIGISLPWVVLGGSLLAVLGLIITGGPLTLKASLSTTGPWSDLSFVLLDRLSATLLLLVSFLGAIISRFSRNYMDGEPREGHFYKWLCITLGSVLCVILSGNLLLFTMAWMATSLSLHHLLLFYREREAAQLAARKKFIISRIGDLCLISAVVWVGVTFGSLDFPTLFEQAAALAEGSLEVPASNLHVIGLLLALGALLKSAQFPFHTWLPDTLETPTPVSALMHAGIINAGGYLIVRLSPLVVLSSPALSTLAIIGAFTAVFAGLIMLTQTSVKKTLAFSTVAQMGFMMLQCGLGAFSLAVLHIVAHSLYKAHAFLSSGELPTARPAARPPSALLLVGTLAFGAAAFVGVHQLLGGFPTGTVYVWVLGLVVVIGLAHFLLHCLGEEGLAPLRWQTGAQAAATVIGLCALYGLLHIGSRTLLGESVAPPPGVQSTAQATVLVVSAGLFALGFALPLCALRFPDQPLLRRIRSHASHGFYCNTLANRLFQIQEIAPSFAKPAYRPSHPAPHPVADETIEEACAKIAPLWPLQHFVAVNPYLGYADKDFAEAARELNRVADANAVPDLATFREVLTKDEAITDADIEGALADAGDSLRQSLKQSRIALSPEAIRAAALDPVEPRGSACQFETFAGFVDHESNGYWQRFVTEDISRHCAAYFDRGQAIWPASIADPSFYQAWHTRMADDFNPDIAGLPGFRKAVEGLPASPGEAIRWALAVLQVPAACTVDFLHAELFSLRGWAGYCQYLRHDAALTGGRDDRIVDLLAVRLVYDAFLFQSKANHRIAAKWATLLDSAVRTEAAPIAPELALRCVLQDAWERSRRRPLFDRIIRQASSRENSEIKPPRRPTLQAVFCIDVRSEIYRRALEAQSPGGMERLTTHIAIRQVVDRRHCHIKLGRHAL